MKTRLAVLLLLFLTACDPVVKQEVVGKPYYSDQHQTCTTAGFCITCMMGFDGKTDCGAKFSSFCPGSQLVVVESTLVDLYFKSGKVERSAVDRTVKVLEACHQ